MIHIDMNDRRLIRHAATVMEERILCTDGYTDEDGVAVEKLSVMGDGGNALVITGADVDSDAAVELLDRVVRAEIAHWVPGASHRLIRRAAASLGFSTPRELLYDDGHDCGDGHHKPITQWIGKRTYPCCAVCGRVSD